MTERRMVGGVGCSWAHTCWDSVNLRGQVSCKLEHDPNTVLNCNLKSVKSQKAVLTKVYYVRFTRSDVGPLRVRPRSVGARTEGTDRGGHEASMRWLQL